MANVGVYYDTARQRMISIPWSYWCTNSATVTTSTTTDIYWQEWCDGGTASNGTWRVWTSTTGTGDYALYSPAVREVERAVETKDQRLARIRREREYRAEAERQQQEYQRLVVEHERERRAAEQRAEQLMIGCLNAEQREQYRKDRAFVVHGRSGRRYRIRYGTHGNIDVVARSGRGLHRLCVQPNGVPVPDAMLAQKLWLEHNEEGILQIANEHAFYDPPQGLILPALQ